MVTNTLVLEKGRYGHGASTLVFHSPLRIFEVGRSKGDSPAHFILSTYGGGMVQGDRITLELRAGPGSKALIHSQANTHVLKNDTGADTIFTIDATLEEGAEMIVTLEPTVLHHQGRYHQKQHWKLQAGARLVLLDWVQSGRSESGEAYEFTHYHNELTLTLGDEDVLVENFIFEPHRHDHGNAASLGGMNHMATVYLVGDFGPQVEDLLKLPQTGEEKRRFWPLEPRKETPAPRERELETSFYRVGPCLVIRLLGTTRRAIDPTLVNILREAEGLLATNTNTSGK